jgi:hypothetical protein
VRTKTEPNRRIYWKKSDKGREELVLKAKLLKQLLEKGD